MKVIYLLVYCLSGRGTGPGCCCPRGRVERGSEHSGSSPLAPHPRGVHLWQRRRRGPYGHVPWPGSFKEQAALLLGRRGHLPLVAERWRAPCREPCGADTREAEGTGLRSPLGAWRPHL